MSIKSSIMIILALVLHTKATLAEPIKNRLFLVGGGLNTCSSMSKHQCKNEHSSSLFTPRTHKTGSDFQFSTDNLKQLNLLVSKKFAPKNQHGVINLLKQSQKKAKDKILNKSELLALFSLVDKENIISTLTDPEYFTLLDSLEVMSRSSDTGQRLKEQVKLNSSIDIFSVELYERFVKQAKLINNKSDDKPNIIVLTASARDPFEAADFYQSVFDQAGANSEWLPLDATLNYVWQLPGDLDKNCAQLEEYRAENSGSVNRQNVYPDLVEKQKKLCLDPDALTRAITNADALFINGGDQSLTLKAFKTLNNKDTEILTLIKDKLRQGSLLVGGTSAGTAVMSGGNYQGNNAVMITNGRSEAAIVRGAKKDILPVEGCQKDNRCNSDLLNSDLTYNSTGGLGLFTLGVLDTHFSERGRQGRLAKLIEQVQSPFAFGVDEATALSIAWSNSSAENIHFEVVGAAGIYIVENDVKKQASNTSGYYHFKTHYITRGDHGEIDNGVLQLNFAPWKKAKSSIITKSNKQTETESLTADIFKSDNFKRWSEKLCSDEIKTLQARFEWNGVSHHIQLTKQENTQTIQNLLTLENRDFNYCSYKNVEFQYPKIISSKTP